MFLFVREDSQPFTMHALMGVERGELVQFLLAAGASTEASTTKVWRRSRLV